MARLEDLINDIADPRLRNQIATEVARLKARKKFGLVFEQHLPEIVRLPGLPVKPGTRAPHSDIRLLSAPNARQLALCRGGCFRYLV